MFRRINEGGGWVDSTVHFRVNKDGRIVNVGRLFGYDNSLPEGQYYVVGHRWESIAFPAAHVFVLQKREIPNEVWDKVQEYLAAYHRWLYGVTLAKPMLPGPIPLLEEGYTIAPPQLKAPLTGLGNTVFDLTIDPDGNPPQRHRPR